MLLLIYLLYFFYDYHQKKKKKKENKMEERFLYSEIRVEHPLSKYSNILNYKHTKGPNNSYLHK